MAVSIQIESRRRDLRKSAEDLLRFARRARTAAGIHGSVSIFVGSSERIQAMNRYFRRKNKPTDVLSFSAAPGLQELHSGDIAISGDIAAANARVLGHSVSAEIKVLILHGMLHLAGYDHETDAGEMVACELKLRTQLKLPASLIERATAKRPSSTKSNLSRRKTARIKVGGERYQAVKPASAGKN